jgi:hypothetical protein
MTMPRMPTKIATPTRRVATLFTPATLP